LLLLLLPLLLLPLLLLPLLLLPLPLLAQLLADLLVILCDRLVSTVLRNVHE
jgi:hypothetical protein